MADAALDRFHPALAEWFGRRFPAGPTEAQARGWGHISSGEDTLIAAPTGSGKTLAAFLVAIDRCLRTATRNEGQGTSVLYVSPLRALTVDVAENLERPLREIAEIGAEIGAPVPRIRVAVRNGDTPQAARAAMLRNPPDIIVTTPESLYLLVTARKGRALLSGVHTVIVDEIHALARDKRGAHLALSLERLEHLVRSAGGARPTRIGCSATQRPIEVVARLLIGAGPSRSKETGEPACAIVDVGHRRALDIAVELTDDELGAVMTNEQLGATVTSLAEHIRAHRTTLVFVNTRRMAERLAHLLAAELGEELVAAHHGSLSTERRLHVEARLRAGELRGVVATASLELGIDVGPVDLVCQLGSPRSIATFLQRVGRAEHRLDGVPKGRIYPLTRDELVECLALFGAVHEGRLDAVVPPVAPLDILAQQIVAECAAADEDGVAEVDLRALLCSAAPYASVSDESWEAVVGLVSEGVTTGRGQRGAYVHRDRVHGRLRARRGARLVAVTSGGAIPELADYKVILEPDDVLVGTVHEDFAVESLAGDVFLLGSTSWRVRRVETGVVRVVDAEGAAPTLPFWLGEAPARTDAAAQAVSDLRSLVEEALDEGGAGAAEAAVRAYAQVDARPAKEVVAYLAAAKKELGSLPTRTHLVLERFFDETGGMQLVVHAPFGARINRGLGLALRKRFCRSFDFELQAAASDDAIVLSLGPQHSFPLEEVLSYLSPATVKDVLIQAVLPTPIFTSRWRWNLSRSLVAPRFRGSKKVPPAVQRMEADDLMAAVFPMLAACQENVTGPIVVPDHVLVTQTLHDCCTEAIDLDGLVALVAGLRSGEIGARCVDTVEASVLSHEILNGRPYTFLDDAPLEERRTRAVSLRRDVPLEARDLSDIAEEILAEVVAEITPRPRDPEELHELLVSCVVRAPEPTQRAHFDVLCAAGRAMTVTDGRGAASGDETERWCATERRAFVHALWGDAVFSPDHPLPPALVTLEGPSPETALETAVRGHLDQSGPETPEALAGAIGGVSVASLRLALAALEHEGAVLRVLGDRYGARRVVARLHARQRDRTRRSIPAVAPRDFVRFLLEWQHVTVAERRHGRAGLLEVIDQLQGVELPRRRLGGVGACVARLSYGAQLLDGLCSEGEIAWGRLSLRSQDTDGVARRSGASPSRATPVSFVRREDLAFLLSAARGDAAPPDPGAGAVGEVLEALSTRGALFFSDLCQATGRLPVEVAEALWDGVARGRLTSDSFTAVRSLLTGRYRVASPTRPTASRGLLRSPGAGRNRPVQRSRRAISPALAGGRWSLLEHVEPSFFEPDALAEAYAGQLLSRYGVLFSDLGAREAGALGWREVLWALRRLEARGVVRGGRFVAGFAGEQYALPEAADHLRAVAGRVGSGEVVRLSATDPLNLTGTILLGPRIPKVRGRELLLRDGVIVEEAHATPARHLARTARPHRHLSL